MAGAAVEQQGGEGTEPEAVACPRREIPAPCADTLPWPRHNKLCHWSQVHSPVILKRVIEGIVPVPVEFGEAGIEE
jgi:hypothetical protein